MVHGRRRRLAALGVGMLLCVAAGYSLAVDEPIDTLLEPFGVADDSQSSGSDVGVTLTEVSDHPQAMWGRLVRVSGRVDTLLGARALVLGHQEPIVGDTLLAVADAPLPALADGRVAEGGTVQATGVVRRWKGAPQNVVGVLREHGAEYDGSAYLQLRSLEPEAPGPGAFRGDKEDDEESGGPERAVDVGDVIDHTDRFLGSTVRLSAEIEQLLGSHAALIGDDGLLVIGSDLRGLFVEARLDLTGTVVRFDDHEAERRLGVTLNPELDRFRGEPAVLIDRYRVVR